MKKIILVFGALLILIGSNGCLEDEDQSTFFWAQTKCADPWSKDPDLNQNELEPLVIQFLDKEGIDVYDTWIEFAAALSQDCEACSCTTGNKIYVRIDQSDEPAIRDLGFQTD
ncbi:hypothetical protein [Flavilitoribacter nigricans]|uniref:Uncharacterized protein n=1 Tax=Flavilitoribacter nigricans (strain ATCC 23147 / DSM 23189 / NBRC 102662 / NCIMB 1420 / SS-2) TaxID=1122177 RepID=A0A2D0N925_FLAN2|nr:hypothetical protein [Flavilitoribacter nigricans]PHN04985.1 hypothetical protein CRP01_18315 [Flavilitoribacter nigricans DSM 23189 = NBRC 102662]